MKRWEYKTIKISTSFISGVLDTAALDLTLNTLGSEGWELVSVTAGATREVVAVLKRAAN